MNQQPIIQPHPPPLFWFWKWGCTAAAGPVRGPEYPDTGCYQLPYRAHPLPFLWFWLWGCTAGPVRGPEYPDTGWYQLPYRAHPLRPRSQASADPPHRLYIWAADPDWGGPTKFRCYIQKLKKASGFMRKEAKTVHNNKKANLVCHFFVSMRKFPQNLGLKRTSCSRAKLFAWFNLFSFKEALFRLFLLTASVFRFAFYIFVSLQEIRNFTGHPNPDPDGIGHIVLFFHFSCCQQVSWQRDEKYVLY